MVGVVRRSRGLALAVTVALAAILVVLARVGVLSRSTADGFDVEKFTLQDIQKFKSAYSNGNLGVSSAPKEEYGQTHIDAFEAFIRVHGMAPTEAAMTHYVAIARRDKLDKGKLVQRMRADMPNEDDA